LIISAAPQVQERAPSAERSETPARSERSGKAAMRLEKWKVQVGRKDFKEALSALRQVDRGLARVGDPSGAGSLKLGERGLTPRQDLVAIDATQVPPGVRVVARMGSQVLIESASFPPAVGAANRSIVEEQGSCRLGMLTGVILVQVRNWDRRLEVIREHGLSVREEKPRIRFLFAEPGAGLGGADPLGKVSSVLEMLRADPRVEKAEPEILFRPRGAK
jgi:hypothetical protein